mmetsp:Transcript_38066/g.49977  ORF Transcript_38066/g.49977 Transcript_38066/m.49977 type:complete len:103 (-) Transcript_38066:1317-1625(-)
MGRYSEKLAYFGFFAMCLFKRLDQTALAALFHDTTSLLLGFGIFVEGIRLVQAPLAATFLLTQVMHGEKRLEHLGVVEAGLALSIFLFWLTGGEPGYGGKHA